MEENTTTKATGQGSSVHIQNVPPTVDTTVASVTVTETTTTSESLSVVRLPSLAGLGRFWDWIDSRDIDKHIVSLIILYGTNTVITWSMSFAAQHADKTGMEVAAIIAAVTTPYMALQAAALKFYFEARSTDSS